MKIKKLLTGMLAAALLVSNVPAEDFVSGDVEESYSIDQVAEDASEAFFEESIFEADIDATDIDENSETELEAPAFSSDIDTAFDDGEDIVISEAAEAVSASIVDSGTCGENLTWTLDSEGTLTISGTGKMVGFESQQIDGEYRTSAPWGNYFKDIVKVILNDGILNIGYKAFYGCRMTSITIPESVTNIEESAFGKCADLKNITLPDGLTRIGMGAFSGCHSLTKKIPNLGFLETINCPVIRIDGTLPPEENVDFLVSVLL